nr:MAG TPA: tail tape measure [Caudoviricetes sp.]
MSGYVDEKVAKVTLDNKGFSKNADDTISALEKLKNAFSKVSGKDATKNISSDMAEMNSVISTSTTKSEGLLSRLKDVFKRSTDGIDMSGAGKSIEKMNADVENRTSRTSDILSRLKGIFQKADNHEGFPNSIKSIDALNSKVSGFDASPLAAAFEKAASSVNNSMSIMNIAVGNALSGMVQKAMSFTGQFFRGPMDGLGEYKDKLGSIQTIMTNTEWEIPDSSVRMRKVSGALQDLNDYADKTIYSFADMTRNIGTFTAAGVSLDKAGVAIKGISNLAAASGSNTQQASTAMYQLSQALAAGKVGLQDWNSVVNAGMGGKLFQDRLTQTAEKMGHARDMTKSFRDSLHDGWLTSEVLLETLKEFSEDQSMLDAATKVKSFGELVGTVQESIGSGWATTWEYLLGGFEEARDMWTKIGQIVNPFFDDAQGTYKDEVSGMILSLGNYRNAVLKTWKDLGGQQSFFNAIENTFAIVFNSLTNLRAGFRSIIGPYQDSAKALYQVTLKLEEFTSKVRNWQALQDTMLAIGKAFGSVFTGVLSVIGNIAKGMASVSGSANGFLYIIQDVAKGIEKFFAAFKTEKVQAGFVKFGQAIGNVLGIFGSLFRIAATVVTSFFKAFSFSSDGSGFLAFMTLLEKVTGAIRKFVEGIEAVIKSTNPFKTLFTFLAAPVKAFVNVFDKLISKMSNLNGISFDGITNSLKNLFSSHNIKGGDALVNSVKNVFKSLSSAVKEGIGEFKKNLSIFSLSDILKTMLVGFAGFKAFKMFKGGEKKGGFLSPILDPLKELVEKGDEIVSKVSGVLDGLKDAISSFTLGIKAGTLLMIATAITMLAVSMKVLSGMSSEELVRAALGIAAVSYILTAAMGRLAGMAKIPPSTAISMIGFAFAVRIMAKAMRDLSELSANQMIKSAGGVAAASLILVASMKLLSKVGKVKVGALKLIAFVFAIRLLVKSMAELAEYDYETLKRAVTSIGVLMLLLSTSMRIMSGIKIKLKTLLGLFVFVKSIRSLVNSLSAIADIAPDRLVPSIKAISILFAELVIASQALRGAKPSLRSLASLIIFTYSIKELVNALYEVSMLDPADMITGIQGLGFLFGALVIASQALRGANPSLKSLASLLIFTYSVKELVNALIDISMLEYDDMKTGIIGMGFVFAALVAATQALRGANPSLKSLASLLVFTYSVKELVDALIDVSMIDYNDMKVGIMGMGFIFTALVAATHAIKGARVNLSALASLIVFSYSVKELVVSLMYLAPIQPNRLIPSVVALADVFTFLVAATHSLRGATVNLSALASLITFAYSASQLVSALIGISHIKPDRLIPSILALGAVIGGLTIAVIAMTNMSGNIFGAMASALVLLSFVPVLVSIGNVLTTLSQISWRGMVVALGGLIGTLTILLVAIGVLSAVGPGGLVGAATLLLLAGSLLALAVPLQILGSMSLPQIGAALLALAGGLTVLILAGAGAMLVAPGLLVLSAALLAFGVAAVAVGAGVALAGVGLSLIILALKELAEVAPTALVGVVTALDIFLKTLATRAPQMVKSLVDIVKSALDGLVELIPKFVDFGFKLLLALIKGLTENVPALMTAGIKLITEIGKALVENMDALLKVALEIATAFIEGLGNALVSVKDKLIPALKATFSVIGDILLTVIGEMLAPLLAKIAEVFGPVLQQIVDMITQLAPALTPIIEIIGNVLTTLIENLPGILQPIADTIKVLVDGIVAALEILAPVVETIVNGIVIIIQTLAPIVQSVVDTIRAAIEVLGQIFTTIGEVIKAVIQGIVDVVNAIGGIITAVFSGIQGTLEALGSVFESVGAGIKTALEGVGTVVESVGNAIKTALEGVGSIFESIGKAIKDALSGVADIIRAFGDAAKSAGEGFKLFGEGAKLLAENGVGAAGGIAAIAGAVAGLGGSAWAGNLQGFIKDIENLGNAINNLGGASGNLLILAGAMAQLQGSIGAIGSSIPTVNTAFESLSTSLGTISGSIGPVAAAFQQLSAPVQQLQGSLTIVAGAFMLFTAQIGGVQGLLDGIVNSFTNIQNGVTLVGTAIGSLPASFDLFNASLGNVQTTLTNFGTSLSDSTTGFGKMGEAATLGMTAMNDAVLNGMVIVQGTMTTSIGQLAQAVTDGFVQVQDATTNSMNTVRDVVAQNMDTVMGTIKERMTDVANQMSSSLDQVMQTVSDSMSRVSSTIQNNMSQINSNIQSSTSQIKGTFDQFASNAQNTIKSMMDTINNSIQNGMNTAKSTIASNMSSIMSTISSYNGTAKSNGYDVGWYISDGIASGIWANVGSIESAAQRIINKANEAARAAAKIHSPSRLFASSVGKYIPQGIAMGIDKEMPKSIQQMQDTFKNGFTEAATDAVKHGNAMAEAVAGAVNQVGDMLDVAVDDMNYTPTITPVIDSSNLDKFKPKDYGFNLGSATKVPTPVYSPGSSSGQTTTVNTDNSTKEYNINVSVDNGGHPVNPKELAKQVQEHMKQFDDENRRGRGEEVLW